MLKVLLLALVVVELSAVLACTSPCVCSYTQCGIPASCADACGLYPATTACIKENQDVCPSASSPQVSCWLTIQRGSLCECIFGLATCRLGNDQELVAGGMCKISDGGIALAVILPLVVIGLIALCIWCRFDILEAKVKASAS